MSRWKFIAALTIVLLVELGLSTEIAATLCVLGAITWGIFLICAPATDRPALWQLAIDIALAAGATIVLAAPFLLYVIEGLPDVPPEINSPTTYSADAVNYIVPAITRLPWTIFSSVAGQFTGNPSEQGAYLGLPLVLLIAFYFRDKIADGYTRALLFALCMLVVLSLGPWLHIGGVQTHVPLPWLLAERLPLLRSALPTRFTMYVALAASVAATLYLAVPGIGRWRLWRFALAGFACLSLVPNVGAYAWSPWPLQSFFTPQNVLQRLGNMPDVLVLPFGVFSRGLAWQLDAGMRFTQSPAYVGFVPYSEWGWLALLSELITGAVNPQFGNDLATFCASHHVNYILMGPGTPSSIIAAVSELQWPQSVDQGVLVTQVPPPTQLQYSYDVEGDYWSSPATFNWMGKRAIIHNYGRPVLLTLGQWRPVDEPVDITLTEWPDTSVYRFTQSDSKTIIIKPNATVVLMASSAFVPDRVLHNGDQRALSVLMSLRQVQDVSDRPR
jgi:hypothetical protein